MPKLDQLQFDNSYARLPEAFYARVAPTPLPSPYLVSFNEAAAQLIDLDVDETTKFELVQVFSGNKILAGAQPIAMLYAGHQFGQYVPQLGDGRAILLGETRNGRGEKWDLHLKGAGQTPYARGFDGRAVLRSTIREYLCSEALHYLGIPTTRALCIIGGDEPVYREETESAAMLLRLAPSHIRFGSFEVFYYRNQHERLTQLADYVIEQHFSTLKSSGDRYAGMLRAVVISTARLIAKWQAAGFAHGVMNTDNMSILGITLDYGPFGFIDRYDAGFICNHSDHMGRYAFHSQPQIGYWNLAALAEAILPLIYEEEAMAALSAYESAFNEHYGELMRAKLGLQEKSSDDIALVAGLLEILQLNQIDYANFFRALSGFRQGQDNAGLRAMFIDRGAFDAWVLRYQSRLAAEQSDDEERKARMNLVNPKYLLRNHLAQAAIDAAVNRRDYAEIDRLLKLLQNPFAEQPEMERYAAPPPAGSQQIIVSCSS